MPASKDENGHHENVHQMRRAITAATETVAQYGYADTEKVTDRDITLAGFGFLADEICNRNRRRLNGKRTPTTLVASGLAIGAALGAFVRSFIS